MNKKAATQKIMFYIFYLLVAFLILYVSASYLNNYFNGLEFNKEFIAKDLGLTMDVLSFSPSGIDATYTQSQEFQLDNRNNNLNVKIRDLETSKKYGFISNIDDFSIKSKEIHIRNKDKITVK